VANIWQLDGRLAGGVAQTGMRWLQQVDTRDGPADGGIKGCAVMIAASPPQAHLGPTDQQSILLVTQDLLTGTGIGQAYERLDTVFRLPSGVVLSTFRRTRPISDEELADYRRRFYEGKGAQAQRFMERFGAP
jgi:hypothetical protein